MTPNPLERIANSGSIVQPMHQLLEIYAHAGVFDAEEVRILTAAFDETWQAVRNSGAPFASSGQAEAMQDLLTLRIIAMARPGERDTGRLRDDALLYLARTNGDPSDGRLLSACRERP
jgi:hypothetical protein